ncbi:MMPL family transporter [Undibacterium sp. TJN25]|uniref:MMPL family transporter n=1 Tax=Undibacterium sp. TJN25 TaxID=3413056 RepID=UPI003BEF81CB
MTETRHSSARSRWQAIAWLVLVLAMAGHNLWLWTGGRLQIDTDILAMLPQNEHDTAVQNATRRLADAASRRIVVLVGGQDWASAQRAGDAYAGKLERAPMPLALRYQVSDAAAAQWLNFYTPYRAQLLTSEQRRLLSTQSPQWQATQAIEILYRPMGMPRIGEWRDDPLNLFAGWLGARAADSKVRISDGRLSVATSTDKGTQYYALLMLEQQGSAFSISAQQALIPLLEQARAAAQAAAPGTQIFVAGVPLHAAAAASQAEHEIHTIGIGSLLGIVVLTLFAFSAIRPRILVTLSIAIGLLAAVSVCAIVFGRLHLITLVFGASLVGVAENYGTNYYSNRLGRPHAERWSMVKEQSPVMWLAMLTTTIGYALLALAPFPGLRQMAVFSATGLVAAFITVLWWFPFLDKGQMHATRLSRWIGSRRAWWPALGRNRFTILFATATAIVLICGISQLRVNDDIRLMQNSPAVLIKDQLQVNKLLDLPGPAQFYLVQGSSADQVLEREQALKMQLTPLLQDGWISGYQAVSDWVPSLQEQRANAGLVRDKIFGEHGVLELASAQLDEKLVPPAASVFTPLLPDEWLKSPVSEAARYQWLGKFEDGYASIILLRGVDKPAKLARLADIAGNVPGVRWVDKVAEVSSVMGHYRTIMAGVIMAAYVLVLAALSRRFGRKAWRALAPSALASCLALSVLAICGQPLQLFNVLALLLILGMGVDYGIFLLEQPGKNETRPFLSITLAAASTLLSFGLLALSGTPALRAFGLTMLLGIALAWILTPLFMPDNHNKTAKPT